MNKSAVRLVECPRDAMQGWKGKISTSQKVTYLNSLLKVGFDTIDFGSFVSATAIPQMADTSEVIEQIDVEASRSRLLAIVANVRGAREAAAYEKIDFLGFPFSISETFQQRNANSSIAQAFERLKEMREICAAENKSLVVYLSMGFGNPYEDAYSEEIVFEWAEKINALDVDIISIADTVGVAMPEAISRLCKGLIASLGEEKFGLHLHSTPSTWREKIAAAWNAGCRRYDGALMGIGGCPMASDKLTGNIDTLKLINFCKGEGVDSGVDFGALADSVSLAASIFPGTEKSFPGSP